jgi:hypothetical protein
MKHMSIRQYGAEALKATTPWAKISLFFRSLSLRYWFWQGARRLAQQDARNRAVRRTLQANGQ